MPVSVDRGYWLGLANDCADSALASVSGITRVDTYALLARAIGNIKGWNHPNLATWYSMVAAAKLPCGGWGIGSAWDAFGDGTTNPSDTAYLITTAQVGQHQVAGYVNNVVPLADLESTVDCVRFWQQSGANYGGSIGWRSFLDYSENANGTPNADHGRLVYNPTAEAASFLRAAALVLPAGPRKDDATTKGGLFVGNIKAVMNTPSNVGGWVYGKGDTARQDSAHNAVIVDSLNPWLDPAVGTTQLNAGFNHNFVAADNSQPSAEYAYLAGAARLLQYPYAESYVDPLFGRFLSNLPTFNGPDASAYVAPAMNFWNTHHAWA